MWLESMEIDATSMTSSNSFRNVYRDIECGSHEAANASLHISVWEKKRFVLRCDDTVVFPIVLDRHL